MTGPLRETETRDLVSRSRSLGTLVPAQQHQIAPVTWDQKHPLSRRRTGPAVESYGDRIARIAHHEAHTAHRIGRRTRRRTGRGFRRAVVRAALSGAAH